MPVVLIVALLLVVVGLGIAAVRVQRRGVPEPTSPSERAAHWSRIVSGALLVVAAILVVVGIVAGLEVWPPSLDTYPGLESLDTSGVGWIMSAVAVSTSETASTSRPTRR